MDFTSLSGTLVPFFLHLACNDCLSDESDANETRLGIDEHAFPRIAKRSIFRTIDDLMESGVVTAAEAHFGPKNGFSSESCEGRLPIKAHTDPDTYLTVSIDRSALREYLDKSADDWFRGKSGRYRDMNVIAPDEQVAEHVSAIKEKLEKKYDPTALVYDFGRYLTKENGIYNAKQERQPFLALWRLWKDGYFRFCEEQGFVQASGSLLFPENRTSISLRMSEREFPEIRRITLDEKVGEIRKDGELVGRLNPKGQKFQLFKTVWSKNGKTVPYEEICKHITSSDAKLNTGIGYDPSGFCHGIFKEFPLKIQELLERENGKGYRLKG